PRPGATGMGCTARPAGPAARMNAVASLILLFRRPSTKGMLTARSLCFNGTERSRTGSDSGRALAAGVVVAVRPVQHVASGLHGRASPEQNLIDLVHDRHVESTLPGDLVDAGAGVDSFCHSRHGVGDLLERLATSDLFADVAV